ncbi:zinc finger domain-containing protein [Streptomyces antarcticus]|uniref:zinc finger domain-containing protein n=1 Tax=Streptomyces antarcticus TaxID=2996458 RepID=UPI00226EFE39|nr:MULTISPECIES: DUF6083 domain-containing protein [unclassified Streptomyces]MCY0939887.1 DUF6083 domain-containing protein [Streptomyces sp. H34-AA3]MCZ4081057.1 DUF6083 domain-containing protein [Streptomyces sp. H34-S5]
MSSTHSERSAKRALVVCPVCGDTVGRYTVEEDQYLDLDLRQAPASLVPPGSGWQVDEAGAPFRWDGKNHAGPVHVLHEDVCPARRPIGPDPLIAFWGTDEGRAQTRTTLARLQQPLLLLRRTPRQDEVRESVACPLCRAQAGNPCSHVSGADRAANHAQRVTAYRAALASDMPRQLGGEHVRPVHPEEARTIVCPRCRALPGWACVNDDDQLRVWHHRERVAAYARAPEP